MTENNSTDNNADPTEDAQFPEPEPAAEPAAKASRGKRRGGFIGWVALLVSLAALAGVGLDFVRDRSSAGDAAAGIAELEAALRNLTTSLGATQNTVAGLEQSMSALTALDGERAAAIAEIERQLFDRLRQVEALPGRIASVEASLSSLQGISTGAREAWLVAEAEYYMQIANVQLQLARNPELALLALTHADERILQLGDPRLTDIRQALATERRALESMEKMDTAGVTLTLASLAATVNSLPLKHETLALDAQSATGIDPELSGMDRAMASLRNAVDGIVSIRRADDVVEPLMAPEAQYFVRANLALQLQAARLALLRGEETVFRQSLDDVDRWLGEYYDVESAAVQSARETITGMRGSVFSVAVPDISRSLRLLRQFNALNVAVNSASRRNNNASAAPADPPEEAPADASAGEVDQQSADETDEETPPEPEPEQ